MVCRNDPRAEAVRKDREKSEQKYSISAGKIVKYAQKNTVR